MKTTPGKPGAPPGNENALGNNGGAPTKYQKVFAKIALNLTLLGYTDIQLAEAFEVNPDTLYEWKKKHIEFSEALFKGKTIADSQVAAALFKRAKGYKYKEITIEEELSNRSAKNSTKKPSKITKRKTVTKEIPPDVGAATMWLKNRQKDFWRDRPERDFDFGKYPEDRLDYMINRLARIANESQG